jgi:hypothetical protein
MPCAVGGAPVAIELVATRVTEGKTLRASRNQVPRAASRRMFGVSSGVTMSGRRPSNTATITRSAIAFSLWAISLSPRMRKWFVA